MRVCKWWVKKTLTLLSWSPLRHQEVRWRPTAKCKQEKKRQYVKHLDLFLKVMLLEEKLTQFFPWWNSAKNMGTRIIGKAVKLHIPSNMARELIAIFQTKYRWWFLVYQRVLPQLHLHQTRHHLRHMGQHRLTEIQYRRTEVWQKEVEVRMKSFGETRCINPQKPKIQIKMVILKKYKEINRMICLIRYRNSGRLCLMHLKSTVYYALPEGPKLWYLLENENNKGFLQKTCWYNRAQSGKIVDLLLQITEF